MKREEYQKVLEELKRYYGGGTIRIADGVISFDITKSYYYGRFGHKDEDTLDIKGWSSHTGYKNIYRRIYLRKASAEEVIKKAKKKIDELKQIFLEAEERDRRIKEAKEQKIKQLEKYGEVSESRYDYTIKRNYYSISTDGEIVKEVRFEYGANVSIDELIENLDKIFQNRGTE